MLALVLSYAIAACKNEPARLETRSFSQGNNKCTVQQLPANYDQASGGNDRFDYYRVIIESKAKLSDSSDVNYVNFGMENSISKVISRDTLSAAFAQRIANGKKDNYEYIVSFEKRNDKNYEILIKDQAFEMGLISVKF